MVKENLILDTDSYKNCHHLCYPPNSKYMFDYIEARGGRFNKTVFFGLQYMIEQYFNNPITTDDVEEAQEVMLAHGLPFHTDGWLDIVTNHGGYLPLRIRGVKEGSLVPVKNALVTVENTVPGFHWLVTWAETQLVRLWYPICVATLSHEVKKVIFSYLMKTCENPWDHINFMLHDFGARGTTCREQAGLGGLAHLVNFLGTDTVQALTYAKRYYHCDMAGFSIPAAEHSTITSWGKDGELKAFRNMVEQFGKLGKIFAVVSDSYDYYNAVDNLWGRNLKQLVKDCGGTLVVRPDSGNPVKMVTYALVSLASSYGYTTNSMGYKVLKNCKVIQGDGLDIGKIKDICDAVIENGFCLSNVAFGMGGGLLQKDLNRDTIKFAMKASLIGIEEDKLDPTDLDQPSSKILTWRDVYKDPVTDPGKVSKAGRLDLIKDSIGNYKTVVLPPEHTLPHPQSELITYYEDGEYVGPGQSLHKIREVLKESFIEEMRVLNATSI